MRKGTIRLLENAKPASYILEIAVTDKAPGSPPQTAVQTIDFQIR